MSVNDTAKRLADLSPDCEQLIVTQTGRFTVAEPIFLPKHTTMLGASLADLKKLAAFWLMREEIMVAVGVAASITDLGHDFTREMWLQCEQDKKLLAKIAQITED